MEDLRELQENEVTVLKSIFSNNCVDLRLEQNNTTTTTTTINNNHNNHQKKQHNNNPNNEPIIRITLFPQNTQSQYDRAPYVQVDMRVRLPANYPNETPKITLENDKGLSMDLIKILHRQLMEKAKTLLGREMIYELCQEVQEFLYINNKPPAKSFYEQHLENRLNLEKQQLEIVYDEKKKFQDQLLADIDQAVDLKRKMLHQERKKERQMEKRERLMSNNSPPMSTRNSSKNIDNDSKENSPKEHSPLSLFKLNSKISNQSELNNFHQFQIEFTEPKSLNINCIKLLACEPENSMKIYRGIEVKTNEIYEVFEWQISLEKNKIFEKKKLETCLAECQKIKDDFKTFAKLTSDNLVKYVAYKYYKQENKNTFIVQICMEYVEGNTIELFITKKPSFVLLESALQLFTIQILDALEHLHFHNVYHRDLKASSVWIESNTGNIKLKGYGLVKKMNNLNEMVANEATNLVTGNLRSDIHQLGLLVLSLSLGEQVKDYHPQVPTSLIPELRSFISLCLRPSDKDCKYLRNHHPFILKDTSNKELQDIRNNKRSVSIHHDEDDDCLRSFTDYSSQSRLNTEFEVIGVIGQGAFGEVLKVKNKLDLRYYAIKRIRMNPNNKKYNKQITRETRLLSSLNHENVVRYYSTWVERYDGNKTNNNNNNNITNSNSLSQKKSESFSIEFEHSDSPTKKQQEDNHLFDETNNDETSESSSSSSSSDESDSNAGCITWSRKEANENEDFNFSETLSDLATSSSTSTTSSDTESANTPSVPSSPHSISELNSMMTSKRGKNKKNIRFDLDKDDEELNSIDDEDDDDSIIFAESSSEKISNSIATPETVKITRNITKKNSDNNNNTTVINKKAKKISKSHVVPDISIKKRVRRKSIRQDTDDSNDDEEDDDDELDDGDSGDFQKFRKPSSMSSQYFYIQMEFCGGKTLKHLIDEGLWRRELNVWTLLREILQGLNHIHQQGMIHRDLKPGNVLIDKYGHAKIGDFGLATTKFTPPKDNNTSNVAYNSSILSTSSLQHQSSITNNYSSLTNNDSRHFDSASMSGAVGTALYVAPELMTPTSKNKYVYTQKVDIYSLGIMFYEMCFPFSTNMERIYVISNLRKETIEFVNNIDFQAYEKQINLIRSMLKHNPFQRPSAKDLLLNESIPRKADEIAFDELLQYSFGHKESTNYKKIIGALFAQKNSEVEEASYHELNKPVLSNKTLQLTEHVFNTLVRTFQKHGGYSISYPLLIPSNDLTKDFIKAFKLADSHGLLMCLPYNQRLPFARYLAKSGVTNIRRYCIGKIFTEKVESTNLPPRERMEASFDIVTSVNTDSMPESEIIFVVNDVINSFPELGDQNYKLVINHTFILDAILFYSGVDKKKHKDVYALLSDFNLKLNKSQNVSKDNRMHWIRERLPRLGLSENTIEKLISFLGKYGEPEKVLSELRSLTKSESHFSKMGKEGISQLKLISNNISIADLKMPVILSTSFVLPSILNPHSYSGFTFQLLVQKKNKKNEFDILASGGRYDKMCAVGVSFDYERIILLINEKSKQTTFRSELAICTFTELNSQVNIGSNVLLETSNLTNGSKDLLNKNQIQQLGQKMILPNFDTNYNSLLHQETRNRLRLFKQFLLINKNLNISTHMIHERLATIEEMDEYCKKNGINSYAYLKETSIVSTSQIFSANILTSSSSSISSGSSVNMTNGTESLRGNQSSGNMLNQSSKSNLVSIPPPSQTFVRIRSLVDRGFKFLEKKFNLSEFLANTNVIINNLTSYNSINLSSMQNSGFLSHNGSNIGTNVNTSGGLSGESNSRSSGNLLLNSTMNISSQIQLSPSVNSSLLTTLSALNNANITINSSYSDLLSTIFTSVSNSSIPTTQSNAQTPNTSSNTPSVSNLTSQLNITFLMDLANRQQTNSGGRNKARLESQIISKISQVLSLFSSRIRIELIVLETADIVIQTLATGLHLEMEESNYVMNWNQCIEKLNNQRYKRQLTTLNLDQVIRDLRYVRRSKVFILYNLKSDQFKLMVAP